MTEPTLFNDVSDESEQADPYPLATATDLFIMRWVIRSQQDAARKELDALIDLACRVEPV